MFFVIINRTTKRVLGFTYWEGYTEEHPDSELIQISEDHELYQKEKPQDYVYDENTENFIYSPEPSTPEKS